MANHLRLCLRVCAGFVLALVLAGLPLRAQLDPRLQGSKTDFLNLYQQSTNTKVKPEILTIFDFSGSMNALMFHPLYVNTDSSDSGSTSTMSFTLNPAVASVPGINTYTITAKADGCNQSQATYTVTVNSDGSATGVAGTSTGTQCGSSTSYTLAFKDSRCAAATSSITVTVDAAGNVTSSGATSSGSKNQTHSGKSYSYKFAVPTITGGLVAGNLVTVASAETTTDGSANPSWSDSPLTDTGSGTSFSWRIPSGNAYTLSTISASPTTFHAGSTVNFSATVTTTQSDKKVVWTDGTNNFTGTTAWAWTVPPYNPGTPGQAAYVSASLGYSYSNGRLVKPSGSLVADADALAVDTTLGLNGMSASPRDGDVRNWVRAASHVRFTTTVGTDTRTVDIPIPWKITNASSTGNPLSSQTVLDQEVKTAPDGTSTTYGSGQQIEMDQTYKMDAGSDVLTGGTGVATTCSLSTVAYKNAYLTWLFSAKYTVGSYNGKYIVWDAANAALGGGQASVAWGQGYGGFTTTSGNGTLMVPTYALDGVTYLGEVASDPSVNVVPALTRVMAVKRAAISTWVQYQADVIWAYRFLDADVEANGGSATTIDNNSNANWNDPATITTYTIGVDSAWTVLNNTAAQGSTSSNGNSVNGMTRISKLFAYPNTPLTYAVARGLAQFTDPTSVFNGVETGTNAPSQCMNHFLIVFTDGIDNNGSGYNNTNGTSPYYIASGSTYRIDAVAGNHSIIASKTSVDRNGAWWNLFTYAGIAAHLGDTSLGTVGTDYLAPVNPGSAPASAAVPDSFLPLSLYKRNTTLFTKPHLVTTMTVGVSLGGQYTDASSPKKALFLAAALGDPTMPTWADVSTLTPFVWNPNLNQGNGGKAAGSIYFFDGNSPDKLSYSLGKAILSAVGASNINTVSNPITPFIGATLGGELLIGKFQPPTNGGSIWSGDLLMFGTKLVNDQLQILDKTGAATTTEDATTAQWSAAAALGARTWNTRKLFTRLPGNGTAAETSLFVPFSYTGNSYTGSGYPAALSAIVSQASNNPSRTSYPAGSAAQQQVIQWAMGGDTTNLDASGVAKTNRSNIMGDIIDSSPAILEYYYPDVSGSLTATLSGVGGSRFRLILVGTNQGWLHAFGEVVKQEHAVSTDTTTPVIVKGAVDELWAFMPTDFLGYLDQLTVTSNPHRFLVDGTPAIYHLDLPPAGGGRGDGIQEVTTAPGPERAMVLFGLGKGGRSYYALDIHDPYNPTLAWSLVPSEAGLTNGSGNSLLTARILARPGQPSAATVLKVVQNMGYSTCTPGIGRLTVTDSSGKAIVHDAVFLGGGFSVPEVEANFPDANGKPTPLGRSVLALDMYTGQILAAVDLTGNTTLDSGGKALTPGPVYKGVVPFEFFVGSGMVQRAYFTDFWGGLWSWGSQKTDSVTTLTGGVANPTYQYRQDSSDLATWTSDGTSGTAATARLVAKDMNGNLVTLSNYTTPQYYYSEALYSTLPAPFRVGSFPGVSKNASGPVPATVGIAIESGDRNNPLDYNYSAVTPITLPAHQRLSVVFDRQDSAAWGSVANPVLVTDSSSAMLNAYPSNVSYQYGDPVITPGSSTYYLAPTPSTGTKFGYFRDFPAISSALLLPKGINTPTVVAGSLFYSYFSPTVADPCTGGTGNTYTSLICDVLNPIVADNRATVSCASGLTGYTFVGVASDFMALGTRGVIQVGTLAAANPLPGTSQTVLAAETVKGKTSVIYPKAKVWRTVH